MISLLDKRTQTTERPGIAGDLLRILLSVCLFKLFVCHTFVDFGKYAWFTLSLTAIMAVVSLLMVIAVFSRAGFFVQLYWILLTGALLISYCVNRSGLEYICNTITLFGILTVLPFVRLSFRTAVVFGWLYGMYALAVCLFAPKFEAHVDAIMPLNTNGSGFVLFTFAFCLTAFAAVKKQYKLLLYLLGVAVVIFQLQFAGRSSLVGTALLAVYLIGQKFFNRFSGAMVKTMSAGLAIFAVIFAYLYAVVLFGIIGHGNVYIFGKDIFTGRQEIWADAFDQLRGHWIFGIGNSLDSIVVGGDTSGVTNLHNQIMGYLTCFGVVVTVPYIALMTVLTCRIFKSGRRKFTTALLLILLVMSYFDTILYSSYNMVYLPVVLVIVYACDRQKKEKLF